MQMKLLLTRIGNNTKMMINGDVQQRDKEDAVGLEDAIGKLSHLDEVEVIQFTDDDCVRSGICKKVLKAYRHY
jgi:phosphate starvation-inducible PhoH-like protein